MRAGIEPTFDMDGFNSRPFCYTNTRTLTDFK